MVFHKGQAPAMGHSHGGLGHGGHKTGSAVHAESGPHHSDHMHNSHNAKHSVGHTEKCEHGGDFAQGIGG